MKLINIVIASCMTYATYIGPRQYASANNSRRRRIRHLTENTNNNNNNIDNIEAELPVDEDIAFGRQRQRRTTKDFSLSMSMPTSSMTMPTTTDTANEPCQAEYKAVQQCTTNTECLACFETLPPNSYKCNPHSNQWCMDSSIPKCLDRSGPCHTCEPILMEYISCMGRHENKDLPGVCSVCRDEEYCHEKEWGMWRCAEWGSVCGECLSEWDGGCSRQQGGDGSGLCMDIGDCYNGPCVKCREDALAFLSYRCEPNHLCHDFCE